MKPTGKRWLIVIQFAYFLIALADTGSFSKAAEKRFVTQPAFSRRIKSLENWFGVDLVDRSNYPAKLTPAGLAVLEVAFRIIDDLSRCKLDVREMSSGPSGSLTLAIITDTQRY